MATTIASRKPYSFTHNTTDLTISITAWLTEITGTTTTYDIIKTSYNELIAQDLTVNLSPFAGDLYNHVPHVKPTTIVAPAIGGSVELLITGNITSPEYYTGYDGWERYLPSVLGISTSSTDRNITVDTVQYISAKLNAIDNILWTTEEDTLEINNPYLSLDKNSIFPVLPSGLTVNNPGTLKIEGRGIGNVVLWTLNYTFVCPYDEVYTIGFINRYGVWEFVDMVGNVKKNVSTDRKTYIRYDEGLSKNFNVNGYKSYEVNTGWVDEAFEEVVTDIMLSEHVILYNGTDDSYTKLIVEESDKVIQNQRTNKMINYQFKFKEAGSIIKIV